MYAGTHRLQPSVVELVGGDVRPRTEHAVLDAGHKAAGKAHLSGDLVWTLLGLRLQQDRLAKRRTNLSGNGESSLLLRELPIKLISWFVVPLLDTRCPLPECLGW